MQTVFAHLGGSPSSANPFYHGSVLRTRENLRRNIMEKSSQTVEERILAAFMQLTEENKLRILAMAAVMQENGEAIQARTA